VKSPVKFGKYYLLERISVGGMAEVFKAKSFGEAGFERLVALKRILPSIAEDQEFIAMFVDEAKLAVQLTHPNIAQIFELGKVGDSYFIALEYVAGKDMRAIFERVKKRSEPIMVPMACYMVMKLCEGLDYAHNKKDAAGRSLELVHRDVSPQNILISYDGDVKLIDFGIAKAASKSSKTQAGILKGKFGYMSPEQVRGLQVDRRSDVFAVGICLYELLTNERLFVGESDFSTLEKVRNVEIMPPTTYNKRIPDELEAIVLKALAKHPEDRYRSAMDLHDDLQSFMYTSGNFFARKDLSAYVHKIFADEISRELSRDDEFRKFDSRRANDLEELEGTAVLSTPTPPGGSPKGSPPSPRLGTPPPPPPPPRAPRGTVMGMGGAAQAAQAAVAAGMRNSPVSPPPGAARPSSVSGPVPAVAVPSLPVASPVAAAPAEEIHEMDWDEEELATQIYDRPEGMKIPSSPPLPPRANSGARPPANGRTTGVLPALPSLPGRNSSVPSQPMGATASAVPAPPMPSSTLQPVVNAPLSGPMISAPAVSAPTASSPSMPSVQPSPSLPPRPSGAGKDAWRIGGDPKFSRPPAEAAPPRAEPRRNEGSSVVVLALLGVVAVAALVIIALKLTRGEPSGGLLITTNVGGVAVLVDSQPLVGNGQRFEVPELSIVRLHRVEVRKPGFRPFTQDVPVREAQITQMQVELEPEPTTAMVPPIVPMPESNPAVAQTPTPAPPSPAQVVAMNTPTPTLAPAPVVAPAPAPAVAAAPAAPRTVRVSRPAASPVRTAAAAASATRPVAAPPTAPAAGGATGFLMISTRPASSCTVSGQGTTFNTPRRVPLPPGTYRVTCTNEELAAHGTFSVTITAGGTADFRNRPLE
jgi:serine/threonine protein kinase